MFDISDYIEYNKDIDTVYDRIDFALDKHNFMITYQEDDLIEFAGNIISFRWELSASISKGQLKFNWRIQI